MKIAFSLENQKKIDENESSFVYLIFPSSLFVACLSSILSINILTNPIEKFLAKNLVFVSYRYHVLCIDCVCVDREESGYTKLQIESFLVFLGSQKEFWAWNAQANKQPIKTKKKSKYKIYAIDVWKNER